ncbi:ABC-F type ribosomal protection protein [Bacillus tianshenii]|nr:ABC-F type ribosomal protection protein [Bacillus tianshenii]
MIACSVQQISKMYGGNHIFENLSFEIHEQDRVGFVGRNGSGKTTVFRTLSGEDTPDSGQIHWKKGMKIGYLAQLPKFSDAILARDVLKRAFQDLLEMEAEMKVLEQQMATEQDGGKLQRYIETYGMLQDKFTLAGGYEIEANIERVANGLRISSLLNTSFSTLSGGEKTKVALGLILLQKPDFLLLDEPTNHLDLMAVEWLGGFLKEYEGTVVVISHDRYFLDEVVTKIIDLEDGEVNLYHTNYSGFVKEKEERLMKEFQAYQEQQKKIKKMKEAIKRLREWANRANPPSEGLHKRARNMERALERIEKLDRPVLNRKKMNVQFDATQRSGNDVVVLQDVGKSYDKLLFKDVNMHLRYQERAAIVGENGTGKSTIVRLLLQQEQADAGVVSVGSNVNIGYLSQQVFEQQTEETVLDTFRSQVKVTEGEARHILAKFLFYGYAVFRKVSQLSGGERVRLRLAQLMYSDINLLLLDEPTNHLDIESREVLEEALEEYNGTILAVSHDRYFLNKLFEKIYWIDEHKLLHFEGDYSWARGKLKERDEDREADEVEKKYKHNSSPSRHVEKKVNPEEIEGEIVAIETELERIEEQMLQETDLEYIQNLHGNKEKYEKKREELYQKLEALI